MKLCLLLGFATVSAALAADAPVFTTTESGLRYAITRAGAGPQPVAGQVVIANYTGSLDNGTVFDSSVGHPEPFAFTLGMRQVIKGWDEGFRLLHVGDRATFIIPPALAYGDKQRGPIPPNSTLHFDVELLAVKQHALSDRLRETMDTKGVAAARQQFEEMKAVHFGDDYVSEAQLNQQGYHYLQKGRITEARAFFEWNVELHPASGNAYDSLGEADLKSGDRANAIAHYEKSRRLDPKNTNAEKMLAALKAAPDTPAGMATLNAKLKPDEDFAEAKANHAAGKPIGIITLRGKVDAFVKNHPDSPDSRDVVSQYFALVELADPAQSYAEWRSFLTSPNPDVRALAESKVNPPAK